MLDNKKKGNIGERLAEGYLKGSGMKIIARNFRTSIGEIDLVGMEKGTLVFVEVKSRRNDEYGSPASAVTPSKIRKINQVASQYIVKHRLIGIDVRFDVVEIRADIKEINHIKNAFDSYLSF